MFYKDRRYAITSLCFSADATKQIRSIARQIFRELMGSKLYPPRLSTKQISDAPAFTSRSRTSTESILSLLLILLSMIKRYRLLLPFLTTIDLKSASRKGGEARKSAATSTSGRPRSEQLFESQKSALTQPERLNRQSKVITLVIFKTT